MKNLLLKICCIVLILGAIAMHNTVTAERLADEEAAKEKAAKAVSSAEASSVFHDGLWRGSAQGYGGTITVEVRIEKGEIISIDPIEHAGEDVAYWDMATAVLPQLVESQGAKADTVSGATFSSSGIINATVEALQQAL